MTTGRGVSINKGKLRFSKRRCDFDKCSWDGVHCHERQAGGLGQLQWIKSIRFFVIICIRCSIVGLFLAFRANESGNSAEDEKHPRKDNWDIGRRRSIAILSSSKCNGTHQLNRVEHRQVEMKLDNGK